MSDPHSQPVARPARRHTYAAPEVHLPPPRRAPPRRSTAALGVALAVIALAILIRTDVAVMSRLERRPEVRELPVVHLMRRFGEYEFITAAAVAVLLLDRRGPLIVLHLSLASYIAFNAVHLGKSLTERTRPIEMAPVAGQPWWSGWAGANIHFGRPSGQASFPSGHSGAAFAAAASLAWFYPRWRGVLWALATAAACSRFLQFVHWPSDCFAGAGIGWASARLSLRLRRLSRPATWFATGARSADA